MADIDSDYAWLRTHLDASSGIKSREMLVEKIVANINGRIESGRLPYTLGVFGGWGTGKTTLLAMLASKFETSRNRKVVYFNSWKYAGFMEIVPALIFKILQYGLKGESVDRDAAARRVILALGEKYSDQIGQWAQTKIGVNLVDLFKDLYDMPETVQRGVVGVAPKLMPDVVRAYYTQVDRAQDELRKALGTVTLGAEPKNPVVVLIDELDRCDPDEAFNVIKQMRVLFGMRDLPVAFVIGANPEPIGLAIKHRYGLESDSGDYEARRILEKFVDAYQDLSAAESLGPLVQQLWDDESLPWVMRFDEANVKPRFLDDDVKNATAFDAITTSVPLFSNIRVLYKSFEYVRDNTEVNRHLLWTKWFLEIAVQIDPRFRRDIRTLSGPIKKCVSAAYSSLHTVGYRATGDARKPRIRYETDKGNTLFAIFRSFLWEHANDELTRLRTSKDPQDVERTRAFDRLLAEPLRMDTVALFSLLPFESAPSFKDLYKGGGTGTLSKLEEARGSLLEEFGNTLAC
jgi:hypothetical protein